MSYNRYYKKTGNRWIDGYVKSQPAILPKYHLVGFSACAILLLGDFITTTLAISAGAAAVAGGTITLSEGNPLMAGLVTDPALFMLTKLMLLGLVVAAAYILRNNGKLAYMPYAIVGSMYLFVVLNNISVLLPVL
jgi:hypothetical protein